MSEILHHYLKGENITNKLREKGALLSSFELTRRNGNKICFNNVLDYSVCCPEEWEKQKAELLDMAKKEDWYDEGTSVEERIEEAKYYPISIDEGRPHDIYWEAAWNINADPMFYISKLLPDEVFAFEGYYKHRYECGCFCKDGEEVNFNGEKCYGTLSYVKNTSIQKSKGTNKIVLPYLDPTKKENLQPGVERSKNVFFGSIYIKAVNIIPHGGFLGTHLCATSDEYNTARDTNRYDIFLTTKNIAVYFHIDNKTEKRIMPVSQLISGFNLARQADRDRQLYESRDKDALEYEETLSDYGLYDSYMEEDNDYDEYLPFN